MSDEIRERGAALLRDGRAAEAVEALREATRAHPTDAMAWRLLGGALAQAADPDGALAAFEEACRLQPDAAKNHYNVALTLTTLGRAAEARERLLAALSLDPGYEQARLRLSEMGGASPSSVPPLTPAVPTSGLLTLGGGSDPVPPMPGGYSYGARPAKVDASLPLGLGIAGLVVGLLCGIGFFLSPVAWSMGQSALKQLDGNPQTDQRPRGSAVAARTLGIIGTVLGVLYLLFFAFAIVYAMLNPDSAKR